MVLSRALLKINGRFLHIYGRDIPSKIPLPPYITKKVDLTLSTVAVQSERNINEYKRAGSLIHQIFNDLEKFIRPGLSTQDIDDFVFNRCLSKSVYPSPLGYKCFLSSVCTSVNKVVCHGIPKESQILKLGDIMSVDISVYNGYAHGDICHTFVAGVDSHSDYCDLEAGAQIKAAVYLCTVAQKCHDAGISVCGPSAPYTPIAEAVTKCADAFQCPFMVGEWGHGIGPFLHRPPKVVHSTHESAYQPLARMLPRHTFTVEPCISLPLNKSRVKFERNTSFAVPVILEDGWTVVTSDKALRAQF
ncbi:TBC1 domain member 31 [Schistosoma haematobium]|uniref:Methionine aminopeptidase 1D, chloroplastic/mitochondrial n=1 Tax=Schistosoma haematobium TaxID=6185 RepID=A0A094ZSU9_SCHHA|nr:TBC1 domain member 31 [Schistosoma haematobium]KAH9589987.1 TBC1 domain member 31 [Schistosoma haematobium]